MFFCVKFFSIYFGIVLLFFFVNLLNPETRIDYLIKRQKQCTIFDYLLNSGSVHSGSIASIGDSTHSGWLPFGMVSFGMVLIRASVWILLAPIRAWLAQVFKKGIKFAQVLRNARNLLFPAKKKTDCKFAELNFVP